MTNQLIAHRLLTYAIDVIDWIWLVVNIDTHFQTKTAAKPTPLEAVNTYIAYST